MRALDHAPFPLAALVALVSACSSSNSSHPAGNANPADAASTLDGAGGSDSAADAAEDVSSSPDAGGSNTDATVNTGPCTAQELYCNSVCVPDDVVNCGTCGHDCTALHVTSTPTWVAGQCSFSSLTCAPGWAHCAGDAGGASDAGDGCETDLSQPAHCGSCTNACSTSPMCIEAPAHDGGASASYSCIGPIAVAAAAQTAFALFSNGTIKAWGANYGNDDTPGVLGNGDLNVTMSATPLDVVGITNATAIAAGDGHACALLSDGTVTCWGDNAFGELGTDPSATPNTATPVVVSGLSNVVAIAAGWTHTCAIVSGGAVKCWGFDGDGELGGTASSSCPGGSPCSWTPVAVTGLSAVTSIAVGGNQVSSTGGHTCALVSGGTVKCWGYNGDGELGNGNMTDSPTPVSPVTGATAITSWDDGSCALLSGGTVKCWGFNDYGQLGNGSTTASTTPVPVSGLSDATALSIGATAETTCAVRSSGAAVCWGWSGFGELGDGNTSETHSTVPVSVVQLTGVRSIATGASFACALLATGQVYCWGKGTNGVIGNPAASATENATPLLVKF